MSKEYLIECSKNSSKFKFVRSMWNVDDYVVFIILNLTQLISHEMNTRCSWTHALLTFLNKQFFEKN